MVRAGASIIVILSAVVACGVASGQTTYSSSTGASVTSTSACEYNASAPCKASAYPSTITVPGGAATVNFLAPFSVTINGIVATVDNEPDGTCGGTSGFAFLLRAPNNGPFLEIMSFAGGYMDAVTGSSITLSSSSGTPMVSGDNPDWNAGAGLTGGNLGTYAPGSFSTAADNSPTFDNYPSPGPGYVSDSTAAANNGSATFSVFNGVVANGTWSLYMIGDDYAGCTASFSSWNLSFASTGTSNDSTSTTVSSATVNPLTKGNSVTFTATVENTTSSTTPAGTVTFSSTPYPSGSATALCSGVTLSGSGNTATAACTPSTSVFSSEGIYEIAATYTPNTGFSSSYTISPYYEWVNNPTTSGGTDVFCNAGTITGTSETNMSPFPSVVTVSGISNAVQDVTVEIKDYSFALGGADAQLMVTAPNRSSAMVLMSNLNFGQSSTATNTGSVTFTDSGAPVTGSNPFAGNGAFTYAPTSLYAMPAAFIQTLPATPPGGEPTVPATAASGTYAGIGVPATVGSATLFSTFNGVAANGTWSLFAFTGDQPMSIGGWCLGIIPASGAATTTVVSGVPNPAATGAAVAITATVSSGSDTPTGTVSFKDGLTDSTIPACGSVPLLGGVAICAVSTLAEGDHTITATYSGETGSFNQSIGSYDQRINDSVSTTLTSGVLTYCNTGAIQIPDPNSVSGGAAYPNPSNITVANLFGTINAVSVALKNFYDEDPAWLTSLLVGPGGNLDFFSGAGGTAATSAIANLVFEDSASGQVPASLGSGPYKPTSDPDSGVFPPMLFTSSPSYPVPGTINSAANNGTSTFASSFSGTAPNGNWDLYFYNHDSSLASAGYGLGGGWCLNLQPNVPTFTIAETHSPDNFTQGSTGQITLNVSNTSAVAVTSGGSAYPVTITDALPNGLTYASISGSSNDWSCSGTTTVTCTSADVVAGGDSYGTLVLNLNVSGTATGGNNPTEVSEGPPSDFGTPTGLSVADNIPVVTAPVLSVNESYSGTFTQGVTGGTLTITVSNTAGGSSSTGGTTTVTLTLPTGYVASSVGGTGWSCSGNYSITCTSTQAVAGGASFNLIDITLEVPTTAVNPTVTNAALVSGGGASASATSGTVSFPVVQVPTSMTAGSGTSPQSAAINTVFGTALSVTVKDAAGNPVNGVSVTFTAPSSGASGLFGNSSITTTVTTNSSGIASAPFTANAAAGGPYTVTASSGSLTAVNFSLSNTAGAPSSMTANAGTTPQSATVSTAFGNALAVTVKDAGNNPVSGVSVTFTAPSSGASGTFSNATNTITVTTNASGVASAPFTANAAAGGPYTVTASSGSLTAVNFSLSNTAGAPSSMTANVGTTPQSATVSTAFGNALAVTVKDAGNNPVSGVSVTFTAPSSGASGTFSNATNTITVTTNASGVASAPFTANAAAGGPYTVTASSGSLTAVNFSLSNTAGAPSSMTANAGATPQSAAINTAFATALSVTVKDVGNNPVSGTSVTFTAPSSGASGLFGNSSITTTVTTNSSGIASAPFTANATAGGPYTVTASSGSLTAVNFSLSNTVGAATHFSVSAPSSATSGTSFSFAVTALDAGNNTATGYSGTVHFTSSDGAATLPANSTLTSGTGTFSATLATAGNQTVTAADTVNFSITGTSNAITVTQASQTISFGTLANQAYGAAPFTISATASSGLMVSFNSTTTTVCTASTSTLSAGVSSATVTLAAVGQCTIQATQSGNATYAAAATVSRSFQVTQAQPGLTIAAPGVAYGVSASVTVTVTTSLTTTPTGTVTLAVDGGTGVTETLSGGAATFSLGILVAGTHTLSVSYSGDTDYLGITATQAAVLLGNPTLTVTKASTSVALGVNGQTVTATVSAIPPGAGTPTGSVQFLRGSTVLGTVPLTGLTASLPNVTAGAVTAVYSGDADFNGSTSGVAYVSSSSLTIASSANPSILGQAVTFAATISNVGAPGSLPTGTVQFLDGTKALGTVSLSNGAASYTTAMLGGGAHTIVAQYSGDSTYPAAQASYNQVVNAVTALGLSVSPAAPTLGQAVVATATVTPTTAPAGFATPTGQVTFLLGGTAFTAGTPVGTVALTSGMAIITLTGLVLGGNELTAEYSGDSTWAGSYRTIVVTVGQATAGTAPTNTSINLAVVSGQLVLTANVTPVTPGAAPPTGSVQFVNTSNKAVVATATLSNGSGVASGVTNVAAQPIEAVYSGDANFQASTSVPLPAVSNAAAPLTVIFAPDELASLYGITGLSGDTTGTPPLPTTLGGATVTITDSAGVARAAQLSAVFASAGQINLAIPAGTAAGLATVTITQPGGGTQSTAIAIGNTAPGIFTANMTGQGVYAGQVVFGNADGSQTIANPAVWNTATNQYVPNPIDLGPAGEQVFLVLYGTGLRHAGVLTASANGASLPVAYFGAQAQFTGLDQINLQVPHGLAGAGLVNLVVMVDGAPANTVTLYIE